MKSPIQLEFTSGIFFMASAEALMTKSFTDSLELGDMLEMKSFNSVRSLGIGGGERGGEGRGGEGRYIHVHVSA